MDKAHDDDTLRFYADTAETYVSSGKGGVSRHLEDFVAALPPGAKVLELGCGGGRDARAMIAAGHDVDATDGTPEIAAKAEALIGRPVRVLRFEDLDATAAYDAVWANASLLHVPRAALPGVLARVHAALRPGGLHMASFKGGGAEGRDRHGRYFNYLSADEILTAYRQSGAWEVEWLREHVGGGYDPGVLGPWIAVLLRRV
ncbi:class I SAM-dependent methyltransferase [Pseudooceanicola sp. LIPI14-2-Ac024]|uniref:class I SAM-dependent methyltransferase n=1 Tax=Pseudooceanicola sp. LIPI14-2-Ac024 TaxID=3344875 RepID=UPI0035D09C49